MKRNEVVRRLMKQCPRLNQQQCASAARVAEADDVIKWATENDISLEELTHRIIMSQGLSTDPVEEDLRQQYGRNKL